MLIDSARELKARLSARLAEGLPAVTASGLGGRLWTRPAIGLAPVAPGRVHLAIRVVTPDDARILLTGLDETVRREVDVRVTGPILPHSSSPTRLRQPTRPLVPGLSVAHPSVSAGTLGGFVRLGGRLAVLSNNHVLAAADAGAVGDAVLQPGPADGGAPGDRVATLAAVAPLAGSGNRVDAAVATLDEGVTAEPGGYPGGPLAATVPDALEVEPDEDVEKVGRTTGHTRGRVSAVEVDGVAVQYDDGVHVFDDQIEIEGLAGPFSAGGDSGSVIWRSADRAPVALLFAGSSTGGTHGAGLTFAHPLSAVLAVLGVEWVAS
ncbi:hypothetical protein SAMN05660690_0561 [Geodermatophilus telluris]|uniref:Trypsin-like peptidase domain-containing protein n=1 Tax=Geodermatophilus telluris TaxID=1190417 RepID=A0A1G6IY31_9ACTN|nr:hypothetical protein [Geodermatophilus telluris]SDC10985.1 hypothetical protein SAMN05660690_0561 [Geodermatophilus telluris]